MLAMDYQGILLEIPYNYDPTTTLCMTISVAMMYLYSLTALVKDYYDKPVYGFISYTWSLYHVY